MVCPGVQKISPPPPPCQDEDPSTALTQPRTLLGDRLGRFIVNRLRVHVRLDERRISEILAGIDSRSMGSGFVATAGRILGHLGDVMTLGFTPAAATTGAGFSSRAECGVGWTGLNVYGVPGLMGHQVIVGLTLLEAATTCSVGGRAGYGLDGLGLGAI